MVNGSLLDIIFERTSVREFDKDTKIPEDVVKQIFQAGITAPSAGNIQPRTFIVIEDETVKDQLYALCENQAFMKDAPLWVVVCADVHRHLKAAELTGIKYDYMGVLPFTFSVLDAALSLENMVIAADALGLGSVIIGSVIEHPQRVKEILKLPRHCLALSILCVGYPKKRPISRREKWNYDVIVSKDGYKSIDKNDVSEYWERFVLSDLRRLGKKASAKMVERLLSEKKQANYGTAYANHYTEEFVRKTNKKLIKFLRNQGFL